MWNKHNIILTTLISRFVHDLLCNSRCNAQIQEESEMIPTSLSSLSSSSSYGTAQLLFCYGFHRNCEGHNF